MKADEGGERKEEEEGEGEEAVNSPMFVPKLGKFFQHDTREGDSETNEPQDK